jgi:hypothetical protein
MSRSPSHYFNVLPEERTASLWHPRNIHIGRGIVIWAEDSAAWVIPGGERTQDESRARTVAENIDALMRAQWG